MQLYLVASPEHATVLVKICADYRLSVCSQRELQNLSYRVLWNMTPRSLTVRTCSIPARDSERQAVERRTYNVVVC